MSNVAFRLLWQQDPSPRWPSTNDVNINLSLHTHTQCTLLDHHFLHDAFLHTNRRQLSGQHQHTLLWTAPKAPPVWCRALCVSNVNLKKSKFLNKRQSFWWTKRPFTYKRICIWIYKKKKKKTNSSHLSEKQREKVCPQIRIPFVKSNVPEGTPNPITCPKITTLLHGDDLFQINLCFPPIRPVP